MYHYNRYATPAGVLLALLGMVLISVFLSTPEVQAAPPRFVAATAGNMHTCALIATGGVFCWGGNSAGQLGDGSTTRRLIPVAVSGLNSGVQAIAAGERHTCALTATGSVFCWGNNGAGQLGDGSTTNRTTPVAVSGLSNVQAISAGYDHTCALTATGGVFCWGGNGNGRLGDDSTTNRLLPVAVSGLSSGIIAITAGSFHTCALTTAGGVRCWGGNDFGQLGDGSNTNRSTPVAVSNLQSGVSAITAGGYHTCALTTAGGVRCWGVNGSGQLGDGSTTHRSAPVAVSGLNSSITTIAAREGHTCALTTAGGVRCWGNNGSGQLGNGSTTTPLTPVSVSGLNSGISTITAGWFHACALPATGGLKCWGNNSSGQFGDGSTLNQTTPVDMLFTPMFSSAMPPATATLGVAYSHRFTAIGFPEPGFSLADGSLPPGLRLNSASGLLEGVPTQAGSFSFSVQAGNSAGSSTQDITVEIPKLTQTLSVNQPADSTYGDPPIALSVGTSSGLSVTLVAATPNICTLITAGVTSSVQLNAAGSCIIVASQSGDINYHPATSIVRTFNIAKAPLTVTAEDATMPTGEELPPFNARISGFVHGETLAGSGVSGSPYCSTTATSSSLPGTYPITCTVGTLTAANYTFSNFVPGTLTITGKAIPQITWPTPADIVYGTVLGDAQLNAGADFNGQPLAGSFTYQPAAGSLLDAGSGQILRVTFTPADGNTFETVSALVQLSVSSAPLTVTAEDVTITAGEEFPSFNARISGFVHGETLAGIGMSGSPHCSTPATSGSLPGTYPITCTVGTLTAANYTFSDFVPGTLTIIGTPAGTPEFTIYLPLVRR